MQKLFEFVQHIGDWKVLVHSDDIAPHAIQFSHLSLDALEGIKAWLEGHPPVPVTGVFDSTFDATFA